jgi:hypothetical protein
VGRSLCGQRMAPITHQLGLELATQFRQLALDRLLLRGACRAAVAPVFKDLLDLLDTLLVLVDCCGWNDTNIYWLVIGSTALMVQVQDLR